MFVTVMQTFSRLRRLAGAARKVSLAIVVSAAMLTGAAQTGHTYFSCRAMNAVMSHACCASALAKTRVVRTPEIVSDCCRAFRIAASDACTAASLEGKGSIKAAALALPSRIELAPVSRSVLVSSSAMPPLVRAGPQKLRVHMLVMVLHV
jgi:hypothetical protein